MGGSPKRGKAAVGCMSRGRLILLAVLAIQLLFVVGLMKAPRLIFSGTSSHANSDPDEEAASGSSLWRRFVAENAKSDRLMRATTPVVRGCKDIQGRFVECEEIRSFLRPVDAPVIGYARPVIRLPQESHLRRRGSTALIPGKSSDGLAGNEMRAAMQRRRDSTRSGSSVGEESGVLRQRRRGGAESRLPARIRSDVEELEEDRRVAGARRVRVGDRLAADPVTKGSISLQLRGSIWDSPERDSFRFRGGGDGYGDHRRKGEVQERARTIPPAPRRRRPAHVRPTGFLEDNASEDVRSEDNLFEDNTLQKDLSEDDFADDSDMARSGVRGFDGRRGKPQRPRRSNLNATRGSNPTSLETSETEVLLENFSESEELEELADATGELLDARNRKALDVLTAGILSSVNATVSAQIGARNGTPGDALLANVSATNATLIELFGSTHNASLELVVAFEPNTTVGAWLEAHNTRLELVDAPAANTTLDAWLESHNVSRQLVNALAANASGINTTTLFARLRAPNASQDLVDALAANASGTYATLGHRFGALNTGIEVAALASNESGINTTSLSAWLRSQNVSLEALVDALVTNVSSSINTTSVSAQFGAHNASLQLVDALKANVSGINATSLDARFGVLNASLELVDAAAANVSGINVGARFAALGDSLEDAVTVKSVGGIRNAICLGGLIYVYTLPKKFNTELLENCSSLLRLGDRCRELLNFGLGPSLGESPLGHGENQAASRNQSGGPWYATNQFNGEVIFHQRMLTHPCRTRDPELAQAFYIPYYGGLDVARFLFNATDSNYNTSADSNLTTSADWNVSTFANRDKLARELADWLKRSPHWKRRGGIDHFLMLGRVTWDLRRKGKHDHGWGSSLINMPEMANVTKIVLERSPWDATEMAIPYPTAFHPKSDAEVVDWQTSLKTAKRDLLFSFAGAPRQEFPNDIRTSLFNQCKQTTRCEALNCPAGRCEDDLFAATKLFTRSTFCLQPRGDSFTRRSVFDALVAGCIPVFFWTRSAYLQYYWHLPTDYSSYSVFIPKDDIRRGAKVEEILESIGPAKVQQMQETVLEMIPRLVYARPEHELVKFKDAFDTIIDKVMAHFDQVRKNQTSILAYNIKHAHLAAIEENPKQETVTART